MSIPLDNLYHWVEGLLPSPAMLYVFRPHGSKNISNLQWLKEYDSRQAKWFMPGIIMHDQEPLDWDLYDNPDQWQQLWQKKYRVSKFLVYDDDEKKHKINHQNLIMFCEEYFDLTEKYFSQYNLRSEVLYKNSMAYDKTILVHSEKNSADLKKYQNNNFVCVHYWAHALLARDWFRFAQNDVRLLRNVQEKKTFLIYARDWSHRREYRLKFLEIFLKNNLHYSSKVSIMHTNSDNEHFSNYKFLNPKFNLLNPQLLNQIHNNTCSSTSSADYDFNDFISTQISIVLETVFDDSRIHLTEKTLRPIACGHPFILAAGPGSLQYIKQYGFKTFAPWIDESYDEETDSLTRLEKIISAMKQIENLQGRARQEVLQQIKNIADQNKKHFFSDQFFHRVQDELRQNLQAAMHDILQSRGNIYLNWLNLIKANNMLDMTKNIRRYATNHVRQLRQSCSRDQSSAQEDPPV